VTFDTSSVQIMSSMFASQGNLNTCILSATAVHANYTFVNGYAFNKPILFNVSKVVAMDL